MQSLSRERALLAERFLPLVYKVFGELVRRRPALGRLDWESVGQMALVRAALCYDQSQGTFVAYASTAIRYALLRLCVRERRYVRLIPDDLARAEEERSRQLRPRRELDVVDVAHSLVRKLPGEQRELVLLKYADGMRTDDIAHEFGVSTQCVRDRLGHAVKKLRRIYHNNPVAT